MELPNANQEAQNVLIKLVQSTKDEGWERALFHYQKQRIQAGLKMEEDQRSSDWQYLVSWPIHAKVLVVGNHLGATAIALSQKAQSVYVWDSTALKLEYLQTRCLQQQIQNIHTVKNWDECVAQYTNFFDVVVYNPALTKGPSGSLEKSIQEISSLVKAGGQFVIMAGNGLSPLRLFNRHNLEPAYTFWGYRRRFKKSGFLEMTSYSPLPFHDSTPLFYLALNRSGPIQFFLKNMFPLFEAVSPEVKKLYRLPYALAKAGVKMALFFKITPVIRYFVPSYLLIASHKNHAS